MLGTKNTFIFGIWLLTNLWPSFANAENDRAVKAGSVSIGGLEIAMFSSSKPISVTWGSQMDLLLNLESTGDIPREPDRDFLIFMVGNKFYRDNRLTEEFRQFFGGLTQPPDPGRSGVESVLVSFC